MPRLFSRLGAVALLAALAAAAAAQPVTVAIDAAALKLADGAALGLRGDTPPLAWDRSLPMADADGDGVHTATVDFPAGTATVAYKAVVDAPGAETAWEEGANRLLFPGRMDADRRAFGAAQAGLPTLTLSQREMARDLTVLREGLQALHPGLTLHNTEAELWQASNALSRDAAALARRHGEAIPMPALYLAVAKAVASVRDGHTQVSMYNQRPYTEALLYARADRVPFAFRLVDGRMVVTGDATAAGALPPGTEILALDGRPVAEVVAALLPYASADGGNDAKRAYELQVTGVERVAERFDVIYSLLMRPEGALALTVRRPDGTEAALSVPRTTAAARAETLRARDPELPRDPSDLLRFRLLDDGTAYLKVGSFATFSMDLDYDAWLVGAFEQMAEAGATRLVVDLRGCAGGMDDAAALLFRHLLRQPVTVTLWNARAAYQTVPEALRPHVRSWSDSFLDLTAQTTAAGDGTYRFAERAPIVVPPAPGAFDGDVAVLVDAAASSATFYLADQIRKTGAATLVGQTTGGSLKGLNAGQMAFLTLPHSGIVVDVPLYGSRPPTPGPDRGVIPDVVVPPDADAVIAGRDPELDAALALLRSRGTAPPDEAPPAETPSAGDAPVPFAALAGEWSGTLTYTDYSDDASRATLTIAASGRARRPGTDREGVDLALRYVEPDGSSGGMGRARIENLRRPGQIGYGGGRWTVVSRELRADGFRVVVEGPERDNNRDATVRHTLTLAGDVFTDRKDVRYAGTDAFFERNTYRLERASSD